MESIIKGSNIIKIHNSINGNNEIELFGDIGQSIFNNLYSFNDFKNDLNSLNGKIIINIKSMGGDLFEALAIYDYIRSLKNKVITKIVGTSASAATIISLAGDRRYITPNSRYLIHKPIISAIGNSDDFSKILSSLEELDKQIIELYVRRSKLSKDEVLNLMQNEKFISADDAIKFGFIDDYVKDKNYAIDGLNNINIKTNDMSNEIYDLLGVGNDTDAKNIIVQLLKTHEATTVYNSVQKIVSKQENANELDEKAEKVDEIDEKADEKAEKVDEIDEKVDEIDEKADEIDEKADEIDEKADEIDEKADEKDEKVDERDEKIAELTKKIAELESMISELKKTEVENNFSNFMKYLNEATQKGKISLKSHNDWINIYNKNGDFFVRNLIDNIPDKVSVVDTVVNTLNTSNVDVNSVQSIMNSWKSGIIDGKQAEILLKGQSK